LRIGSRDSKLARWQADWVVERLRSLGQAVEVVEINTSGDIEQKVTVASIGSPGIFTKEIQRAVLEGDVDLAVHSLKDLPTEPVAGLHLAAVPPRESPADALVARRVVDVKSLPHGARVGTGSLRRQAQLRHFRPDLQFAAIRGNVDTRLRKLDDGQFDALILAAAGLRRLGLADRIAQLLPYTMMLPAVGQGALAIECRADDSANIAAVAPLNDAMTRAEVLAERSLLRQLRGGCLAPIGAWGRVDDGRLHLSAVVLSADGVKRLDATDSAPITAAEELGQRVADTLLDCGAAQLISAGRSGHDDGPTAA
jgi:hydroxymethylbilane synthase